jgi:hypothetical protein
MRHPDWRLAVMGVVLAIGATALGAVTMRRLPSRPPADPTEEPERAVEEQTQDSTIAPWVASAPFRRSRRPASVRYSAGGAQTASGATPQAPSPPKPALKLRGLVVGAVSAGVLEGVPGREGPVLVRAGDTLSGLRIRQVTSSGVTIAGLDTTWHLRPGEERR